MRCFVALELPAPVCNHLTKVIAPLREAYDLKWVARDQMHLTLVFAGDVPNGVVDELREIVRTIELPTFELALADFGCFPPRGIPRVIWAALGGDIDALRALQDELAGRCEPLGIEREKRGFSPHVTLGRLKNQFGALALVTKTKALAEELKKKPFAPIALTLFESRLTPQGPLYEPIERRVIERPIF